jgi:hypothetical protein
MATTLNPVSQMIAAAVASAVVVGAFVTPDVRAAVVLGMVAPLAAAAGSWIVIDHTYRQDPLRVTGVMFRALLAKAVFFLAYVVIVIRGLDVRPEPFAISLAAYFVALYAFEAFLLRRLFSRAWREARS